MIKLGVISDSHGARFRTEQFAKLAKSEQWAAVLFCGDGLSDARWLERELPMEIQYVAGNCDPGYSAKRELLLSYGGVRFLLTHGDRYSGLRYDLSSLSLRAEEAGAAVAVFGHTHRATAEYCGPTLMVNPGALKDGRYAILEVEDGRVKPFLRQL